MYIHELQTYIEFSFGYTELLTVPSWPAGGSISHRFVVSVPFYF